MIKVGVVGCGFWGRLLVRSLAQQNERYHLRYFCDVDTGKLDELKTQYGYVNVTTDVEDILRDQAIDAVVIATPIGTHYEMTRRCLEAGKHVFVEQPLALDPEHCAHVSSLAEEKGLVLLVDHIDEYNTGLSYVKEMIRHEELGDVRYLYSQRLNLGEQSSGAGVLQELASHEAYVGMNVFGFKPIRVTARGLSLLNPGVDDVAFVAIDFEGGVTLHIHASWVDPNKTRRLTVVGSGRMVEYDDVSQDSKVTIYDSQAHVDRGKADSFDEFQLLVRRGDVIIPKIDYVEPLKTAVEDFATCIMEGCRPRADAEKATRVVQLLSLAEMSMAAGGTPLDFESQMEKALVCAE